MNKNMVNGILSLVFGVATIGAFFWLWTMTKTEAKPDSMTAGASSYQPVEIESVKKEAKSILDGLEQNSDVPIQTPLGKMGRKNPFADI